MARRQSILYLTLALLTIHASLAITMNGTIGSANTSLAYNATNQMKKLARYTNEDKSIAVQYMSEVGSRCADDGFFADRDDCRKFHVCYGGTQSVRWCKEGMLWDETKVGCSMQSVTPCIGNRKKWTRDEDVTALPKIVSTAATSTSTVRLRSTTTSNAPTSKGNYTCRPGATGFFADASSCSLYHWCVIGVLQSTHRCTAGLHFSASANGCLWPKDAECEGQIAPPYSPVECLAGRSGYFPDPYDCSVFHYCDGGKGQSDSLLCSSGLVWSPRLESCAWPHEVTECQNACPANYSSQMRFADPVICNQYVQCVDGHLEQRTCSNNLLFDRITKTCKPYEQAECHGSKPEPVSLTSTSTASTSTNPENTAANIGLLGVVKKQRSTRFNCMGDGYFGDAHDCRIYHVCVDERDYRSMCAPGLAWESLLRLCMPTHLVGCQSSKSFEPPTSASKKKWFHPFTRSPVKSITTLATTTATTTPPAPFNLPSMFTCAGRTNGYYPDPVHCHKFHYCATGWHSLMECDTGLAYSARDNDCVPMELVDCGNTRSMRKKH